MQYVGKTEREFRTRVKEHVRYIENGNVSQATGQHFSQRKFADDFSPIIKGRVDYISSLQGKSNPVREGGSYRTT